MRYAHHLTSQHILKFIARERLKTGAKLPSIRDMAQRFDTSVQTVQWAVHELSEEGFVEARGGSGVYVRSLAPHVGRGRKIGLLLPGPEDYAVQKPWPGAAIGRLTAALRKKNWTLTPVSAARWYDHSLAWLRGARFAALALFEIGSPVVAAELRALRRLMISIDSDHYAAGVSSAVIDQEFGVFEATRALLALGHRRIAFLRWISPHYLGGQTFLDPVEERRIVGYRLGMQQAGLPPRIEEAGKGVPNLRAAVRALLSRPGRPTALVCQADWAAVRVAREALELGLRIPEDLSVVGFGGEGAEFSSGRGIASVRVDGAALGEAAARLILKEIDGENQASRIIVPAHFESGDSIAPPSATGKEGQREAHKGDGNGLRKHADGRVDRLRVRGAAGRAAARI